MGAAIKAAIASGEVKRSDVFVTTKISTRSPADCTTASALAAVKADVQQLGLTQVDLVLQHFPCSSDAENQAVWTALVEAKASGLTRAIGVSHFSQAQLQAIMSMGKVSERAQVQMRQWDDGVRQ